MAIRKVGPTRDQRAAIIKRYLKPDQNVDWAREMITFAALWKQYPSLDFWTRHELPFALNHMSFFQTPEGAAMLESDWAVFHYNPAAPAQEVLDNTPQPAYTVPYTPPVARPRTVAEFLKTS
jgi:hypothetical protein